jgi:uncharacterized phiE125 gp8 family phage protein
MDIRLITAPAVEPVSLSDAQEHLRAGIGGTDATLIEAYLQAAREAVENHTGRALMPQTWELRLQGFPDSAITLQVPPLLSVTSVRYTAPNGTDTLLDPASYQIEAPFGPAAQPATLWPAVGTTWPGTRLDDRSAVRVRFQAGYANAGAVPAALRAAILLVLGELYENREASAAKPLSEVPAVRRLLDPYRVHGL